MKTVHAMMRPTLSLKRQSVTGKRTGASIASHHSRTLKTQVMQLLQEFFDFNSVPLLFRQPDSCEEILALKFHSAAASRAPNRSFR